jgi:methylated-DNA-protein-cysteine methyltransferase-like protein
VEPDSPVENSPFRQAVHDVLKSIKPGEVLTYGEVAEEAGFPRSARAVGRFLRCSDGYPWWRIVTASGRLVPGREEQQTTRLRLEGVTVENGHIAKMHRNKE